LSREVAVYRQTPDGIKSFKVDLDDPQVHSIELKQDWSLHADLNRTQPLWFVGRPPYRRCPDVEAEKADGRIHAEVPSEGGIEIRRFTPQAWELTRIYQVASEEEAKALLQHCGKGELPGFFPATTEPKPSRKVRRAKKSARPGTLKELAAFLDKQPDVPKSVPEFLLLIDERISRSDHSTVPIPLDELREKCHSGKDVDRETIRRNTIAPARHAVEKFDLPYRIRLKGDSVDITRIR
jgi:hypothetical protein